MLLAWHELRYIDDTIGFGAFATRFIPRGTITWVRDRFDQTFSAAEARGMSPLHRSLLDRYAYVDSQGDWVLCWDHARFLNHSCEPTCLSPGFEFEIAVRDIHPGEEITDDYGTLNLDAPFDCACKKPGCRRKVGPGDVVTHGPVWEELIRSAFSAVGDVPQPLWDLVAEQSEVRAVLEGRAELPSWRIHILSQGHVPDSSSGRVQPVEARTG